MSIEKADEPLDIEDEEALVEGRDFYFDEGLMVLTGHFLLKRGFCCGRGCRHCPYNVTSETTSK